MATREFCRPDPEELLRKIEAEEAQSRRGRLKIFVGYAPRVGKSFRMFDEGRRRAERGQDVVVGAMQSKGSEDLAPLLANFEVIPLADGGGIDIEAILRRAPQACLIDQLASDNPPGSCCEHRWQDVEKLLDRGINVISAINLQYIAELQPEIEKLTGRRAPCSVPQSFIRSADEIVVVDVPPEDLHSDGNRPESSLTARQLSNLRELALLLAAEVVESQLQRYMDAHGIRQSWGTQERILVCMTPRSEARAMLQTGRYSADRFHGHLMAVYVKQRELTREAEETLAENLELARRLGAEVNVLEGTDPMGEIINFAREQRVTQIFIGHTQRSSWQFWNTNPVDRLIEAAEGIDVRIFPTTVQPDPHGALAAPAVRRGKLKVFLGYAAGVGKTYQSLEEAQLLKKQGVDVVIGYFEPHGRKDTIAKTEGLEMIPRQVIEHRGTRFEEMDTAAIIRRHPAVCLVDEFAHANVPGVEHQKRWEDVMEILDAGIDVLTSLNVQHIESLNDQVWYFTGVRVRETVPDWVIKQADEVVMVDVTPRALLHRLERGVVYAPDKAQRALENFFTESNLTALRELAMRQTAHQIEDRLDPPVKEPLPVNAASPAGSREQILLWLTPDPTSAMLVRRGHRVADYLHVPCIAVAIGRDSQFSELSPASRAALDRHLTFARNLHIEVATACGTDPAKTLAEFARQRGITQIFVARNSPDISKLVHLVQDMQITIVAGRPTAA